MRILKVAPLLIVLGCLFLASCNSSKKTVLKEEKEQFEYCSHTLVNFIKGGKLSEVLDHAQAQNKLTFVEFYTDWCLPCEIMDESVFVEPNFSDYMNSHFVNYKIDAEKDEGPSLRFLFNVEEYPTFVFLDSRGRVMAKESGSKSSDNIRQLASQAMEEFQRQTVATGE